MQAIVSKVAVQAMTGLMTVLGNGDAVPRSAAYAASLRGFQRQRHGKSALEKPSFK